MSVDASPRPGHDHAGHDHLGHDHSGDTVQRAEQASALKLALGLILTFMTVEVTAALISHSLALLSDAAHMLTDAAALVVSLLAARLAARPAQGAMTYGMGRAEILSAQANGLTMIVLGGLIVYGGIARLVSPPHVTGGIVLVVAVVGIVVNLVSVKVIGAHHGHDHGGEQEMSLNVEGSYRHLLADLFGFIATAIAAAVIIVTGFRRADAIASLLIAGVLLHSGWSLLRRSVMVIMEAAPAGIDPDKIGRTLAAQPGVSEVHDLHIWEVTTGFPSLSAHVVVAAGHDCHEVRRGLSRLLADEFNLPHSTLQVEHARAEQPPLSIEIAGP
jgi:cobalt-zinc-cadmium efflux system protein